MTQTPTTYHWGTEDITKWDNDMIRWYWDMCAENPSQFGAELEALATEWNNR